MMEAHMKIQTLSLPFTICKLQDASQANMDAPFCFLARTDEEISLVCPTDCAPSNTTAREDGWRAFRIQGVLDFSLVGILAQISALLAAQHIGIFAVSTYNTDYILTKAENYDRALTALASAGYEIL